MPNGLQASAASASLVLLAWQAATDNVGVTGYRVFRDGVQIATPATNTYSDATVAASSNYSYTVAAVDAAGNASPPSSAAPAATPAPAGNVIAATPTNYRTLLAGLKPGDTLLLAPGNYGTDANGNDTADPPGLPIFNMHGTAAQPITIKGPDGGPKPLLIGRSTHNTIRFSNASYIVIKGIEVDGRDLGGSGVSASGAVHRRTSSCAPRSSPAWSSTSARAPSCSNPASRCGTAPGSRARLRRPEPRCSAASSGVRVRPGMPGARRDPRSVFLGYANKATTGSWATAWSGTG